MYKKIIFSLVIMGLVGCNLINPIAPIMQIGVFWVEGEAHKYYATPHDKMEIAVKEALQELDFVITQEEARDDYLYLIIEEESKFRIKIRPVRENVTKVSIRINTFGDRPYAEMIYRHIDAQNGVVQFASVEELNVAMNNQRRILH